MKTNDIIEVQTTNSQALPPQDVAKQAGENIHLRREGMKLSQEGLAKSAHVEVEKIIEYENGAFMQDLINICRIAEKLKCSPEALLTYSSKRTKQAIGLALEIAEDERKEKKKGSEEAKTLGRNIRKKRKELGLTQSQLAEKIEASGAAISRYENGCRMPKGNIVQRIAECLGTTSDELLKKKMRKSSDLPNGYVA